MNPSSSRATWFVCIAVAVGIVACKRPSEASPQVPLLGSIAIAPMEGDADESLLVDREALAQKVRSQVLQTGVFAGEAMANTRPGAAVAKIRISLSMEVVRAEAKAAVHASVRLNVSTFPTGVAASHFGEDAQANAEMIYDPEAQPETKRVMQRLAESAVADLIAAYIARQRLWTAAPQILHATLVSPSETRLDAIRVVAARKLKDEVPTLIGLLSDDEETIRDTALGALVALGDPRAVPALTKSRSMKDGREMRKIIDAIAALGGQEAADYLNFVAEAHEDEEIRGMAKAGLVRLKKRSPVESTSR